MSAVCSCGWTGSSSQVADGGRCPECREKITYTGGKLICNDIASDRVFNRRFFIAAAGLYFGDTPGNTASIIRNCASRFDRGLELSIDQQRVLFKICVRYADQITDTGVVNYAIRHARGAD